MAITKVGNPPIFSPVRNPNYWYFSSTNVNNTGFKFLVTLYSAGTSTQLGESYSVWPRPTDGYCELNLNVLKDYVSFDVYQTLSGFSVTPDAWASYNIEVGETYVFEWTYYDYYFYNNTASTYNAYVQLSSTTEDHEFIVGDLIGVIQNNTSGQSNVSGVHQVVEVPNQRSIVLEIPFTTSGPVVGGTVTYDDFHKSSYSALTGYSAYTVFNGSLYHNEFADYDYQDYQISTGATGMFLTNCPNNYIINENNNVYLNFYSSASSIHAQFLYLTNSNGDQFRFSAGSLTGSNQTMMVVNAGPLDLPSNMQVLSGSLPLIKSSTTYYSVYLATSAGTRSSEIKTFYIEQDCFMYNNIEIYFFDRLGSLIPVNFELNSKRSYNYDRKDYKKKIGDLSSGKYTYGSTEAGRVILNVNETQVMTAHKDQLTTDERIYLKELIGTYQAYVKENGQLWPIIITDNNYEELTQFNENYLPFVINFIYANNNIV